MLECFKKDYSEPSQDYGSHGEGEQFISKWGYIIPHTKYAQGAETPDNQYSEYTHGSIVAAGLPIPFDHRNDGGISGACERLSDRGVNSTWEDHRNAYNGIVGGAEILYLKRDHLSKVKAEDILHAFSITFPDRTIRGAKARGPKERGGGNLVASKKSGMDVALLGELFFIDNPKDFIETEAMIKFLKSVLI